MQHLSNRLLINLKGKLDFCFWLLVHKWRPPISFIFYEGVKFVYMTKLPWEKKQEGLARIYYVAPASSLQFSFSIVKLPSESAKFIVTKTLWQGRMWDYYKSFSDKKYIFGSKKILFISYSGIESTFILFVEFSQKTLLEGEVMRVPMT